MFQNKIVPPRRENKGGVWQKKKKRHNRRLSISLLSFLGINVIADINDYSVTTEETMGCSLLYIICE